MNPIPQLASMAISVECLLCISSLLSARRRPLSGWLPYGLRPPRAPRGGWPPASPSGCSGPSPASRPTTAFRRSCCSRAGQHTRNATTRARPFSGLQTRRAARVKSEQCEWRRRESGWLGAVSYQRADRPWSRCRLGTTPRLARLDSTTRLLDYSTTALFSSSPSSLPLDISLSRPHASLPPPAIHGRHPFTLASHAVTVPDHARAPGTSPSPRG